MNIVSPYSTHGRSLRIAIIVVFIFIIHVALSSISLGEDELKMPVKSGPVSAVLTLKPAEPLIGDIVTLEIEATAEKDVELLMPVFGEALDRFTILDFVPRKKIDDQGRTIETQKYRLQPPVSGKQAIPPILIEFIDRRPGKKQAPDDFDAYELLIPRLEFEVQSVLLENAQAELKPPLGKLDPLTSPSPPVWPWALASLIILGIMAPFLLRAWNRWQTKALRRTAYEIASGQLDKLLSSPRPNEENVGKFFVELSGIVRRYLENRFELRAPELTTEEFLSKVSGSPILSVEHQRLLHQFLREADLVKFAGLRPSPEIIEGSLSAARRFLDETRENAPLIELDQEDRQPLAIARMEKAVHE